MKLTEQLKDYINAAFTGLWVQTHESDEAEREISRHAQQQNWRLAIWDIARGLRLLGQPASGADSGAGDPIAALRALPALADPEGTAVLVLHNFHRFLSNPEVIQAAFVQLIAGKQQRAFVIVLAPVVQIPVELEKQFVVIEHSLPDREQLQGLLRELMSDRPDEVPKGEELTRILDAASGLTRYEAEGAFALSLARQDRIVPTAIWELKAQVLKKNNLLTLHQGTEGFSSLGGMVSLKDFCKRALRPSTSVRAKGILLLGVPGTGKSAFAKALGNETGRPTLILDIGALYGSLVGATEANIRQALRIADAMSPSLIFIDELEKALGGIGGTGDSGVSTRLFGTLLTYLSDRTSDTFVVGTCNDISKLPPEFSRAERWDGLFFLDLPDASEKESIWWMYRQQFGIPESQARPDDTSWTGAEIKACCRLAALLDVPLTQAARQVVPVAVTASEQVEKLRSWASGRCLSSSQPGIYGQASEIPKPRRRVQRGLENN